MMNMTTKTFEVPNISCGHCTNTIEMEVIDLAGVLNVKAEKETRQVTVEWDNPAIPMLTGSFTIS